MRILISRIIILGVCICGRNAIAIECGAEAKAKAKQLYGDGERSFRLGELRVAAQRFKAGYEACPQPLFLYNIAQAERQLQEKEKALFFYKQYLATSPDEERKADVQKLIHQLEIQIENDRRLQNAPPPGPAAAPTSTTPQEIPPENKLTASNPPSPSPGQTDSRRYRRLGWGLTIAGVCLVGVGAGLAGYSASLYSQARNAMVLGDQRSLNSRSDAYGEAGWSIFGVGAASVVGGVITLGVTYARSDRRNRIVMR